LSQIRKQNNNNKMNIQGQLKNRRVTMARLRVVQGGSNGTNLKPDDGSSKELVLCSRALDLYWATSAASPNHHPLLSHQSLL
jgi:hypothetical protein